MSNRVLIMLVAITFTMVFLYQGVVIDTQGEKIDHLQASIEATDQATMRFAIDVGADMRLIREAVEYLLEEDRGGSI